MLCCFMPRYAMYCHDTNDIDSGGIGDAATAAASAAAPDYHTLVMLMTLRAMEKGKRGHRRLLRAGPWRHDAGWRGGLV